jgi:hypothetical protein
VVKIKYLLAGVLIVIIGIVVIFTFFPNEEKKVKKQFHLLSEWVLKSPDENIFTMLQKIKNIGTLFDEYCELKAPDQSLSGSYRREEISTYAGSARSYLSHCLPRKGNSQSYFNSQADRKIHGRRAGG